MRIALATCRHPGEHDHDFDFLAPSLRRRGAEVEKAIWDDERVGWEGFDLVLINSTWDYQTRPGAFRKWLAKVDRGTRLLNRRETVEWNLDKRYLAELERAGIPTIPTVWTEPGREQAVVAAVEERGWTDIVIKPVIDAGASKLARVEPEMVERILLSLAEPGMAQQFLTSVLRQGELSLIFFDGEFSHALDKLPARGDFRVQPEYGGRHERTEPTEEELQIGRAAIAAAPGPTPLYARVDLVRDDSGALRLIELELIEPALYLDVAPGAGERLARALLAAAS